MALNVEQTRQLLQSFDFQNLFREELGWGNPKNKTAVPFQTKEGLFYRKAIADLSGASVFEITSEPGNIPDTKGRSLISNEIQKLNFEHILIFIDKDRSQSIWRWLKKQDKKSLPREHYFLKGQTGDAFIGKLSGLMVDISEIENDITITDVARKIQKALDVEKVTKRFYKDYQQQFDAFVLLIEGIDNEADRRWYASVIINRLMFIYFLQQKGFIDNNNRDYLWHKAGETKKQFGKNKYYCEFLNRLFFEGFAKPEKDRDTVTKKLLGNIKYLNGGLFLKHKIEEKFPNIAISDVAFEKLLRSDEPKGLFEQFSWSLDDTPGGKDDEINPGVLGYIFEKYINQKAFGAYYTRPEITEYLCEQTVYKLILDEVNEPVIEPELLKKAGLDKGPQPKCYGTIEELLLHLDAATCRKLIYGEKAVLTNLSLLDPACGSGAFLVAAMKTLINVYAAVIGRIEFLGDRKLTDWKKDIEKNHNIQYFIKREIITNNLYGVDIMEEATEIAKLRLFLALVSSAKTVEQLEPLPNIDFNIMNGNSLIGLMRVDANQFNKHITAPAKKPSSKLVKASTLFEAGVMQGNIFSETHAIGYLDLINTKERLIKDYKSAQNLDADVLQNLRNNIQAQKQKAMIILNELLLEEFTNLEIRYETVTWDEEKNKEGRSIKRALNVEDIKVFEPFHWGYEFSEIFTKKKGFDAIITNPPWETFQPNAKEYLMDFSSTISLKKMEVKDFEKELQNLMKDKKIREEYLKYNSSYNHSRQYFRFAHQYKNQVPIINGKRQGKDVNLYKLFVEQSFNLLHKSGYCGIVIPSGIYSDLGAKKLREMLFENTSITGLFCFENKKEIFENVHRSFKFVVLSFDKEGVTESFPAAFVRHDVQELNDFPNSGASIITIDLIKKQSPDSLSISELKNELEFAIARKVIKFPFISDKLENKWNLEYKRELNMTDDAYLFQKSKYPNSVVLYEGKMIWQFLNKYSDPKFWIDIKQGREALIGKVEDKKQILSYQKYRLAYRDISSPTNERTMINTILQPNVFTGNTLYVSKNEIILSDMLNNSSEGKFRDVLRKRGIEKAAISYATNDINCLKQSGKLCGHNNTKSYVPDQTAGKVLLWLIERWWMLPVRYNFLNLSRYGGYCEKAIRDQFAKKLPFVSLFDGLYSPLKKKECILAFDPTFIAKAGKKTMGLGWFWNGTHQRAEKGLEVGILALIDVADKAAYHFEAVQTAVATEADKDIDKRMEQYIKMMTDRKEQIQPYTTVVVADGYFMKKSFIEALTSQDFEIITKGRRDANLKYLFHGQQKGGQGRPKQFSGKVNLHNIDKRVWKKCYEDKEEKITAYEAVVYSVILKCKVKAVYVQRWEGKGYELLISTDEEMKGEKVLEYYRLRFQIEFLIRDAKTYTGLEHCQARSEEKLYNHWNMALFSVSLAKWQVWAKLPQEERKETAFSMRSIKTWCMNKYMAETIFANLGLDLSANKIKKLFNQCLNIGSMAA